MAATKKRRRWPWLLAALLLFVVGAWVMAGGDQERPERADKVFIPRYMSSEENDRAQKRKTLPLPPPVLVQPGHFAPPPPPRDPVLAAMPPEVKKSAWVIEANAIRNSDLGNLMVDCVFGSRNGQRDLARMRDAGFDPLTNLDRVSVADDVLMLSGDFSKLDFNTFGPVGGRTQFGPDSELITTVRPDGGTLHDYGIWKQQMMVIGNSRAEITDVLDRLDGKGPADAKHALSDSDSYGELYGLMKPGALAEDLGEENPALAKLIEQSAASLKFHADVSHDVGLSAEITGSDLSKTEDLRKAMGTALTLAKLQAEAKGDHNAAEVLGFAHVAGAHDSSDFRLEAGLPYEFLEKHLKKCIEDNKKSTAEPEPDE